MARKTKKAAASAVEVVRGVSRVKALSRKRFRRSSIDAFSEDFTTLTEVAAEDVYNGRLSAATNNSAMRSYANMLHMLDIQMRVRTMAPRVGKRVLTSGI